MNTYKTLLPLIIAVIIAFVSLNLVGNQQIDLENLAKGKENTSGVESYKGQILTASSINNIKTVVQERYLRGGATACKQKFIRLLWLGNSQLHYINQYREGEHLSPYWLKMEWDSPDCIDPLGFSLPNANLQEFFILSQYVSNTIKINGLILELVFDDLREDNLRDAFSKILSPEIGEQIYGSSKIGENIIERYSSIGKTDNSKDALDGTIQKPVELWLSEKLGRLWSLWANRSQIEGDAFLGLYNLRNWVFGIKPTTTRKMIKARYELNMEALDAMLSDYQKRDIPVLLYIAPIRQDKPLPYELTEYSTWKEQLKMLADKYHATMVNLETHIPPHYWGSYVGEEIDFMHFQGPGHKIVAEALLPHVKEMLKRDGKD